MAEKLTKLETKMLEKLKSTLRIDQRRGGCANAQETKALHRLCKKGYASYWAGIWTLKPEVE